MLAVQGLTTTNPSLQAVYQWQQPWSSSRTGAAYLSMAVGDMNNDGPGELLAAYDDGRGFESLILTQADLSANTPGDSTNHDPRFLDTPTDIALGDMDNNSIKAIYGGDCREIVENRIVSTLFKPPSWQNIQQPLDLYGGAFVGQSKSTSNEISEQLTYERSSVISGYVGTALSVEKGVAKFEASVKATMSQEYMNSSTRGNSTATGVENSVNYVGPWDMVQTGATTYYCYNYTVMQSGAPVGDNSSVRSCEAVNKSSRAMAVDTWDADAAFIHSSQTQALEWAPASRDWASLSLFREAFASQSSAGSGAAGLAADGNLSGELADMSSTAVQDYPWWEMDLGQVEDITKIRIWSREDPTTCPILTCTAHLSDVYVFVSETPFSPADTPTTLLADPNVLHYSLDTISPPLSATVDATDMMGRVTTFVTLKREQIEPLPAPKTVLPQQGRYVRVQINRTGAQLQLAEVQIFGTNHVEPNRYPNDFRTSSKPGYFEVSVYNPYAVPPAYEWVETRGELLWTGLDNLGNPVFADQTTGRGDSEVFWDRKVYTTTTTFTSGAIGQKTSVGVEFEISGGAILLAQAGVGYEFSTGVTSETTHLTTWGESFEFGGWAKGFPRLYDGEAWTVDCEYNSQPYYYVITEESSFGYKTSYTVLDYLVTDSLDRSRDLSQCLQGHATSSTPTASNDETAVNGGQTSAIQVLANDAGPSSLHIMSVGTPAHGTTWFSGGLIFYKPDAGFAGTDSFDYTIGDGSTSSTGMVTLQVKSVNYLPVALTP